MKFAVLIAAIALVAAPQGEAAAEFFDRVEDALTFSTPDTRMRARLSGAIDLEGYSLQLPAPGVIYSDREQLFVPRLTVFLDAQAGSEIYLFAQARADRGFDPSSEGHGQVRLDEYALRYSPNRGRAFNLQVGRFATIVGNWANRHDSWTNPFITAPLPYENLTGMWDSEAIRNATVLLQWSHVRPGLPAAVTAIEKSLRLPIIWGPEYASGAAIFGGVGKFRYAADVKFSPLSSRPESWEHPDEAHPTISARLGYRPSPTWNLGVSASTGPYLRDIAESTLPAGRGRGRYRETVLAHDIAFAWHHWQWWGEVYAARFEIPDLEHADTLAYYVEAKYKFTPQFFAAVRWNEQFYNSIPERTGPVRWGRNVSRLDLAPGYRFTPNLQWKFQYSLQRGDNGRREFTRTLATQLTQRF